MISLPHMLVGLWLTRFIRFFKSKLACLRVESFYGLVMLLLLFSFMVLRCPWTYRLTYFLIWLVMVIFPLYLSLFMNNFFCKFTMFFSKFLPRGCPAYLIPFVSLVELVRCFVRPVVLVFRPFVNITIGSVGCGVVGYCCLYSWYWLLLLILLMVYEVFVAIMHWYIVHEILDFTFSH